MDDDDNDDAICKRTRARHSLAHYSLEELETFLQESDDDGDLHNIDDEEEYHKFLAAVLLGSGDDNEQPGRCDGNVDEDEDNDADFVIELEEALESDADENGNDVFRSNNENETREPPETRHQRRLKKECHPRTKKKTIVQGDARTPLRPILPYSPNVQAVPYPCFEWQCAPALFSGSDVFNGFTPHQVGQLYCLIHEHVQLLIQILSVSILDPSKKEVASAVEKMLLEINDRREEAVARRTIALPQSCFHPAHLHSSVDTDIHCNGTVPTWKPMVEHPVLSVLDVTPLRLVKGFMTDVSAVVLRYRERQLAGTADKSHLRREPLFTLANFVQSDETNSESPEQAAAVLSNTSEPNKPLDGTLVEGTKNQPVALVPVDIAKLAQRFLPLFDSALFPNRPPFPAVVNRVLFTEAEDRLLAMGLMEYNNNWGAIQQRFLPCKSKHQIFVRQKNRSSSRAPENSIKAVRRMKTSPLTADEIARISEGLKFFKQDWSSVWKFCVPYRDPSLLPRQWRIANGTQKSYKSTEKDKLKRRLYEAKRRKIKTSITGFTGSSVVDYCGDNRTSDLDEPDEAYIHEAFLTDPQLGVPNQNPLEICPSDVVRSGSSTIRLPNETMHVSEESGIPGEHRKVGLEGNEVITSSKPLENPPNLCPFSASSSAAPYYSSRPFNGHISSLPYRARKSRRVVKLAPDLPPVNLPRSVRVMSRSSLKPFGNLSSVSKIISDAKGSACSMALHVIRGTTGKNPEDRRDKESIGSPNCRSQKADSSSPLFVAERNLGSDLHLHPLLFPMHEDQLSSYYAMNCNFGSASTYNFFSRNLLHSEQVPCNPQALQRMGGDKVLAQQTEAPTTIQTIDFHPLLQRSNSMHVGSTVELSVGRNSGEFEAVNGYHSRFVGQPSILRKSCREDGRSEGIIASPTHNMEQEIDLDIRLYSTTKQGKQVRSQDIIKFNNLNPVMPTADAFRKGKETGRQNEPAPSKSCSSEQIRNCNTTSSLEIAAPLQPSNAGSRNNLHECRKDDLSNESFGHIVMEQEELSDSDEEDEHVEFEREEMDDSEEEVGDIHSTEVHNKDVGSGVAMDGTCEGLDLNRLQHPQCLTKDVAERSNSNPIQMQQIMDSSSARVSQLRPKCERKGKDRRTNSFSENRTGSCRSGKTKDGENMKVCKRPRKHFAN